MPNLREVVMPKSNPTTKSKPKSKPTPEPRVWKQINAVLAGMDDLALRGLVLDLYKLSPENRAFLAAWIGDDGATAELLDTYKEQITSQQVGQDVSPDMMFAGAIRTREEEWRPQQENRNRKTWRPLL
jgi:hypothetical protein